MTFRQKWLDKRLAFDSSKRYNVSTFSIALHQQAHKLISRKFDSNNNGIIIFLRLLLFKVKMITLKYEDYGKKIWTPDTFIVNSVKGNRHDIVEPNNYLRIFPDGEVLYSERYVFFQSIRLYSSSDIRS